MSDSALTNERPGNSVGRAKELLSGILERMGMEAEIVVKDEDDRTTLEIHSDDVQRIIGRRGQVIDALQHLVGKMLVRDRGGQRDKPIVVDAGGYRERHLERLRELAERMAEKALKTRRIVELNPMPAHDRRIVHMALAEMKGVSTRSEGEGEDRHILVVPD